MQTTVPNLSIQAQVSEIPRLDSGRLFTLDVLRGIALAVMALEHAVHSPQYSLQAEYYGGVQFTPGIWLLGLMTNVATPTFWVLGGVSISLLVIRRRRQGLPEWSITRFLLIRGAILLLIDLGVFVPALLFLGQPVVFTFSILGSLGVSIILLSVLRLIPKGVLLLFAAALWVGYQFLVVNIPWNPQQPGAFWVAMLLEYSPSTNPTVWFPVLGWFPLMCAGFILGQSITSPALQRAHIWSAIGGLLLGSWLLIRLHGGYGNFVPYTLSMQWPYFFLMSKAPPSLVYHLFNLGLASLVFAMLCKVNGFLNRPPLRWLGVIGQASLFFFVSHKILYSAMNVCIEYFSVEGWAVRFFVWFSGLVMLLPMCYLYRRLRKHYPKSILQYF